MKRLAGMLGLCMRAGRLVSGEEACEKAVRTGRASLVLIDEGMSANGKKALGNACGTYGAALYRLPEGLLEAAIGKAGRRSAAIVDGGFAGRIREIAEELQLHSGVH
ncbi:MAG: 50S ribosomal protein L7ae [Clostridia bacterium]|nr:50S ribosomal protein L7ae [Clostridia bacterium]